MLHLSVWLYLIIKIQVVISKEERLGFLVLHLCTIVEHLLPIELLGFDLLVVAAN